MKKALSLMAALSLMLTFAACGDSSSQTADTEESKADSSSSEEVSEESSEAPSDGTKEKINVYSFTNEVPDMVQKYIDNKNNLLTVFILHEIF